MAERISISVSEADPTITTLPGFIFARTDVIGFSTSFGFSHVNFMEYAVETIFRFMGMDGVTSARILFDNADGALSAPLKDSEYTLNWCVDPGTKPVNCAMLHDVVFVRVGTCSDTTR